MPNPLSENARKVLASLPHAKYTRRSLKEIIKNSKLSEAEVLEVLNDPDHKPYLKIHEVAAPMNNDGFAIQTRIEALQEQIAAHRRSLELPSVQDLDIEQDLADAEIDLEGAETQLANLPPPEPPTYTYEFNFASFVIFRVAQ
jgi:hypothetical protein